MKNKIGVYLLILLIVPCLSFSAFATTNFTPSVQAVEPKVVPINGVYAEILDNNGTVLSKITDGGQIIVTPLSKAEPAEQDIKESLLNTYQIVKSTPSLSTLIPKLSSTINKLHPGFPVSDLVARDLFNVAIRGNIQPITNSNRLRVTISLGISNLRVSTNSKPAIKNLMISQSPYVTIKNLTSGTPSTSSIVIAAFCEGDKDWPIVDPANVVINGDGTVTFTLSKIGTMLIIVEGTGSTVPAMSALSNYRTFATITAACVSILTAFVIGFEQKQSRVKIK